MSRIGIMGGTFNPIHFAHINMAKAAYSQADLDKVLFMPSKNPPHKHNIEIVSQEHRAAMVKLAIEKIPYFEYSDFEFRREGTTYSAQTLELLCRQNPNDRFFFIMGADSFFQIENWYMPERIMKLAAILAVERSGVDCRNIEVQAEKLKNKYNAEIMLIKMPGMDVSSSIIRKNIYLGRNVLQYIPENVWEYIEENRCYMQ